MSPRSTPPPDPPAAARRGAYGQSQRQLAEAAIRYFEERGFADTKVADVAASAGYSERTFFRQFPSKEDVVFFDIPDFLEPLQAIPAEDLSFAEAWRLVGSMVVEGARTWENSGPDLAERRARMIHEEPALYRRFVEIATDWEVVISEVFARARGTDVRTDLEAQLLAGATVAGCRSSMRVWVADPSLSLGDHMQRSLDLIGAGFGSVLASD